MEIPQKSITLKSTMVAKAEAATRQIEAVIEPLSHDGFDIAITLAGADRCALSKSVCVTWLGLAD